MVEFLSKFSVLYKLAVLSALYGLSALSALSALSKSINKVEFGQTCKI